MFRTLKLLVLAIASGSVSIFAATLSYDFDFFTPVGSSPQRFFYQSEGPTDPGTSIAGVDSIPFLGMFFSTFASRDFTGAWVFSAFASRAGEQWATSTDLSFPNSPGVYSGLPALRTFSSLFGGTQTPGTVDITIESVPEPGTSLLALTALVAFSGACAVNSCTNPVQQEKSPVTN